MGTKAVETGPCAISREHRQTLPARLEKQDIGIWLTNKIDGKIEAIVQTQTTHLWLEEKVTKKQFFFRGKTHNDQCTHSHVVLK